MAWTGIKVIHDDMRRSTDYVQDPEKTMLENSVDYAFNRDKTETTLFESAIGCINETAYQEMLTVKRRFHKEGGVQGYHLVQSFQTDEVTPEQSSAPISTRISTITIWCGTRSTASRAKNTI